MHLLSQNRATFKYQDKLITLDGKGEKYEDFLARLGGMFKFLNLYFLYQSNVNAYTSANPYNL